MGHIAEQNYLFFCQIMDALVEYIVEVCGGSRTPTSASMFLVALRYWPVYIELFFYDIIGFA